MSARTVAVRLTSEVGGYVTGMKKATKETQGLSTAVATAGKGSTQAAQLHEVGAKRASRAADEVHGSYSAMGTAVKAGAALAGAAVLALAHDAVNAASDLAEQMSATKTLFGESADELLRFADGAEAIGLSKRAALEAANAYGDFFIKIGYTQEAAAALSEDLVRVASDFASFKNLDPSDVLGKLRAGLAGESEPLRELGVFLTEAKVKAEGMELGLADAHGELTEGEKITTRYKLILEEMGDAYGDVARTSDSYANQQRRFAAETENLKANVGRGLLPVLTDLSIVVNELVGSTSDAGDAAADSSGSWLDSVPIFGAWAAGLHKAAEASKDTAGAIDYLSDSEKILANSQNYTKEQVEKATQSLLAQEQALDALLQATQAQFSSEIAGQRSVLGLRDSLRDLNGALAANKDSKKDNNVTSDEMTRKQLAVKDSILQVAEAAVRTAEDHAAAAGKTLTESEKYDVFRTRLKQLREQFPQLRTQIDTYIGRLKAVPPTVPTKVTLTGADRALTGLTAVDQLMNTLDGKHATVTVTQTTEGLLAPPSLTAPPVKKAAGGWISAPGGLRGDMVPA